MLVAVIQNKFINKRIRRRQLNFLLYRPEQAELLPNQNGNNNNNNTDFTYKHFFFYYYYLYFF